MSDDEERLRKFVELATRTGVVYCAPDVLDGLKRVTSDTGTSIGGIKIRTSPLIPAGHMFAFAPAPLEPSFARPPRGDADA